MEAGADCPSLQQERFEVLHGDMNTGVREHNAHGAGKHRYVPACGTWLVILDIHREW